MLVNYLSETSSGTYGVNDYQHGVVAVALTVSYPGRCIVLMLAKGG
jgi:hypothetical protein